MEREKDALIMRANSLKRAIRNLVEHTEAAVDEQNRQSTQAMPTVKISLSTDLDKESLQKMDHLKVLPTIESGSSTDVSSCPSPTASIITARLASLSPMPDLRRDSAFEDPDLFNLPVPPDFADSRRASQVQQALEDDHTEKILLATRSTLQTIETQLETKDSLKARGEKTREGDGLRRDSMKAAGDSQKYEDDEKECSSILSVISNEEASIISEVMEAKSFCPRKGSDGEDVNGHIGHIDSPETDTYPNSEALHGESLMDDIR